MSFESITQRYAQLQSLTQVAHPTAVGVRQANLHQPGFANELSSALAQTSAQPVHVAPAGYAGDSVGQRIVARAQGELGVSESPPGSNDGARIRTYRSATRGALNVPGPWCAYFVSWLGRESGAPIAPGGHGTGWVPAIESWGRNTGRYFSGRTPQPGDIAIFERTGDGIADHTGIVERVGRDGRIHTIEGNTSENRVSRRSYSLAQIKGFVRPG